MSVSSSDSNQNKSIKLARNTPIALVVGCAGFLGSRLTLHLIERGIQVIGIDDLSTGTRKNLEPVLSNKRFEFLEQSIIKTPGITLPRLDYAFFLADEEGINRTNLFRYGIPSFLRFAKDYSPKITLVSDIAVYDQEAAASVQGLRQAEIFLAKYVKEHKLNARIVRLASVFGPGMKFLPNDKLHRLISESLDGTLSRQNGMLDLATRAVFVDDAVGLIIKSALGGGTAHKIYDGALLHPVKLSEIKEVLLKPELFNQEAYKFTELPEWPTPNLLKTVKELSWHPKADFKTALKETLNYFHQTRISSPSTPEKSFLSSSTEPLNSIHPDSSSHDQPAGKTPLKHRIRRIAIAICLMTLIGYGLIYPLLKLSLGALLAPTLITNADSKLQRGNLAGAKTLIDYAGNMAGSLDKTLPFIRLLDRLPYAAAVSNRIEQRSSYLTLQVEGTAHVITGLQDLTQIFSRAVNEGAGESQLFLMAQSEFTAGWQDLSAASEINPQLNLSDTALKALASQGQLAGGLLSLLAGTGDKSYLVILVDNSKPTLGGGEIESIGQLKLTGGQISQVEFASSSSLDRKLPSPLGADNLGFEDLNSDPDFPTTAKEIEQAYQTINKQPLNGVIMIDKVATAKLVKSLGGVVVLNNASYKRILDLLPVIQDMLNQKHILLYADDPTTYAYLISNGFSGAVKRPQASDNLDDFLGVASMQASGSGILKKSLNLTTQVNDNGGVSENLKVTLENTSTASASAALALYLPRGAEVQSATIGGADVLPALSSSLSDGRSKFFINLPMQSGTEDFNISYVLSDSLYFKSDTKEAKYQLAVFKQNADPTIPLTWSLKLPSSIKIKSVSSPDVSFGPSGAYLTRGLASDIQINLVFSR